jgi:hypothetical protein
MLVTPVAAAAAGNDAVFISHLVQTVMVAGESYPVQVTFKNTGSTTWTRGQQYRLGSQNPRDTTTWLGGTTNRVELPSDMPPGGWTTFSFTVTAPQNAGTYDFQWQMVQDGVEWFGGQSLNVPVMVVATPALPAPVPVSPSLLSYANLRGANLFETDNWIGDDASMEKLATAAESMHLNVVRINLHLDQSIRTHSEDAYVQSLVRLMDIFQAHHLKAIVTLNGYLEYDRSCGSYMQFLQVQDLARKVVTALKDHSGLLAWEMLNEAISGANVQGCSSQPDLASNIQAVYAMYALVRSLDTHTPTTVSEVDWPYLPTWKGISSFVTTHIYPDTSSPVHDFTSPVSDAQIAAFKAILNAKLDKAKDIAGALPLVLGEFGIQSPDQVTEDEQARVYQAYYDVLKARDIGSTFWNLGLHDPSVDYTLVNTDGSLKKAGQLIQSQFAPFAPPVPVQTPPPPTPVSTCIPRWSCGDWSLCSPSGSQNRTCIDVNRCGSSAGSPGTDRSCTPSPSSTTPSPASSPPSLPPRRQSCIVLPRNISFGSRGSAVVQLQTFLIGQSLLAAGNATGYFGPLTQRAVQAYQRSHNIVSSGAPSTTGYGAVGPRTRASIAAVCTTQAPTHAASPTTTPSPVYSGGGGGAPPPPPHLPIPPLPPPPDWSTTPTDMRGMIRHMYACALNREPESSAAIDTWVNYFAVHRHRMIDLTYAFFTSPEYKNAHKSKEQYVTDLYHCILFREPDPAGLASGVASISSTDFYAPFVPDKSQEFVSTILPKLSFLEPNWNGVIDMGEVVAAFPDKHPHQAKERTEFVNTAGVSSFIDKYRLERRSGGDVIGIYYSEGGSGGWIYDQLSITADRVGYTGTFPIFASSTVGRWDPMIPLSDRFITPGDTGKQFVGDWDTYTSPSSSDSFTFIGRSHGINSISSFGVKDFGGNIGKRWYVTFVGNLADLASTQEYNTFDLGPTEGVYDPEYSQLAYEQRHRPWVSDPNSYAYEYFGQLVELDPHGSFFNYFSF